ncbi:MAG: ECF-type sigma factor [Pseudomonadota bacterium]|nr:ECF-type sigma factor [Pseudomonadota bacterium]
MSESNAAEFKADISQLLMRWKGGDRDAETALFEAVYPLLRQVAARSLRSSSPVTLQATELVNEAYMRLLPQQRLDWQNRAHFCAIAAHAMRKIISNHIRDRHAQKRGGFDAQHVALEAAELHPSDEEQRLLQWLSLDEALEALEKVNQQAARAVELRHIAGLNAEQTAEALGVSLATEGRLWRFARAFLETKLGEMP